MRTRTIKAVQAYDPELIIRLKAIRRSVQLGEASAETEALWRELQTTVLVLAEELSGRSSKAISAEVAKDIRAWVTRFANAHWPAPTLH